MKEIIKLSEIKKIELDILIWFDRICKKHGLVYSLAYGTLLGAIRHNGFIPWDDDVDVMMPRKDYDRLCEILKESQDRYHLYAAETDKKYLYPFAKLVDSYTYVEEIYEYCGVDLGLWIDIFPMDNDLFELEQRKKREKEYNKLDRKLWFAMSRKHTSTGVKKVLSTVYNSYLNIRGRRIITDQLVKFGKAYNSTPQTYINCCVTFYNSNMCILSAYFENIIQWEFENNQFSIISNFDEYLTINYGDYMTPPPKEKQLPHHSFKAYWR